MIESPPRCDSRQIRDGDTVTRDQGFVRIRTIACTGIISAGGKKCILTARKAALQRATSAIESTSRGEEKKTAVSDLSVL